MASWIQRLWLGTMLGISSLQAYPLFVCGDLFRELAQWRCDEREWSLDPSAMRYADIVFVKADWLPRFFREIHPQIQVPYILVAHNSDAPVPGGCVDRLNDPMILHWYAQHMSITSQPKRITPIPIGVANPMWRHGDQEQLSRFAQRVSTAPRRHLFYLNFQVGTNPRARQPCLDYFTSIGVGPNRAGIGQAQYLTECLNAHFVISPPGNAIDCHRTWEALILGCIPIVHTTTCDRLFEDLPVWVVPRWEEVTVAQAKIQRQVFRHQYLLSLSPPEKVYGQYWADLILRHQTKLRQQQAL